MTNIVFLNNWGESPKQVLDRYNYQTPNHDRKWNDLVGVESINNADYYIVLDGCHNLNSLDLKKTICFQREPPCIVKVSKFAHLNCALTGTYQNHFRVATWMIKKKYSELLNLPKPSNMKLASTIVSNKQSTYGHRRRLEIIKKTKEKLPYLDLYGKAFKPLTNNGYCKFDGIYGYKYGIAFENWNGDNSFTEKMLDCILCWSKPIYWGCPNISKYLPEGSYAYINIEEDDCVDRIIEEINKPVDYESIAEARNIILTKLNIWPAIEGIIQSLK